MKTEISIFNKSTTLNNGPKLSINIIENSST